MKTNKKLAALVIGLACIFYCAVSASAQKRKAPSRKTKTVAAKTSINSTGEIKSGAEKVSIQIKNLSKFIYVLGGVAQGIEDIDKDIKTGKVSRATVDQNEKNKQAVVGTMRNLRAGLAALEVEFRTSAALKNYLSRIQGITDMSGEAEEQAAAGQLNNSGKTLLLVIEKLTDTLASLP